VYALVVDIDIRRATPEDAEAIARIQVGTWRAAYRGLVPDAHLEQMSVERSTARHREALAEGRLEVYLAWEAGEAVGFVGVGSCRDEDADVRMTGEVWGIYVLPSRWRRRVGARLCRFAEQILGARGFSTAVLWVFAGNANARRFYEAMGYAPDGASKILEVGKPLEAIRYRRGL
jgi:GNAT superfamily N-acetyltransferase